MSTVRITPSALHGEVRVPASKSAAHRALIAAFLAGGGEVSLSATSEDIFATQKALTALQNGEAMIDCHESGSTLRFLIPLAAACGRTVTFTGKGKLPERPIDEYLKLLPQHGVQCAYSGRLPLTISGQLTPGRYEIAGDVSSQYLTGLLLALPVLSGDSELVLTTSLQSKPYVDMTLAVMRDFGVIAKETAQGYFVPGNQQYRQTAYTVEGDWSQAAFFLVGGALTGDVTVMGLNRSSAQGDKRIVEVLRAFGADITQTDTTVTVKKSPLHGITLNVSDIPDAVPAIAAAAACAEGVTVITGAERLKYKESDRLQAVAENLRKAGVNVLQTADGLQIEGGHPHGAALNGFNDHRIVMAMSVLALAADGETTITDAESVNKSYPDYFIDYNRAGGKADVIRDGK